MSPLEQSHTPCRTTPILLPDFNPITTPSLLHLLECNKEDTLSPAAQLTQTIGTSKSTPSRGFQHRDTTAKQVTSLDTLEMTETILAPPGHGIGPMSDLQFSLDGKSLATSSLDQTSIWCKIRSDVSRIIGEDCTNGLLHLTRDHSHSIKLWLTLNLKLSTMLCGHPMAVMSSPHHFLVLISISGQR
jgi:hypothetical protein